MLADCLKGYSLINYFLCSFCGEHIYSFTNSFILHIFYHREKRKRVCKSCEKQIKSNFWFSILYQLDEWAPATGFYIKYNVWRALLGRTDPHPYNKYLMTIFRLFSLLLIFRCTHLSFVVIFFSHEALNQP